MQRRATNLVTTAETMHRLRPASLRALRALDVCPLVPIDVVVQLIGARNRVSAYQLLSRLRACGLVEARRVNLGPILGYASRRLWSLTGSGRDALRAVGVKPAQDDAAAVALLPLGPPDGSRCLPGMNGLPLRVAAVHVLAATLAANAKQRRALEVLV